MSRTFASLIVLLNFANRILWKCCREHTQAQARACRHTQAYDERARGQMLTHACDRRYTQAPARARRQRHKHAGNQRHTQAHSDTCVYRKLYFASKFTSFVFVLSLKQKNQHYFLDYRKSLTDGARSFKSYSLKSTPPHLVFCAP